MLHVTEYRGIDRLFDVEPLWEELRRLDRSGFVQPTLSDFLQPACRSPAEPRMLVVSMPGRLLGIVPLMQRARPLRFGAARLLVNDPAIPHIGGHGAIVWLAAMRYLKSARCTWDGFELRAARDETTRRLRNAMRMTHLPVSEALEEQDNGESVTCFRHYARRRYRGWRLRSMSRAPQLIQRDS